ncbi:cytosine methyltransferase [Halomonas sp. KHS3]|nr:cytosine methyltransferase [Halomonas sp. KHS3]
MCRVIQQKIERIRAGNAPRVLDLFAGCGGISLGFHAAGFQNIGAVEFDPAAARSHAMNFHGHLPEEMRAVHAKARDITTTEPFDLLNELGIEGIPEEQVDVIVGGPPCQAFARVGRAKLREVAEHPEAYLNDPRGNLYLRYLQYVTALHPVAILMENVPDVLNFGGHNIAEEVCEALRDLGYEARYTMLNAVFYGVPEMRERMFLVAYRKELQCTDWFPSPTHWIDLPRGYHGSRQVAMKTIKRDLLDEETRFFIDPPEPEQAGLKPAVTAEQALSDLPKITDDSEQKLKKGPRRFDILQCYPANNRLNEFQRIMRNWEGFESGDGVHDHVIRYLPRDYKIFARMKPGDQYPQAHTLANEMFEERLAEIQKKEGFRPLEGTERFEAEKKSFIPPYDPNKFPNKWRKMEADKPARTLMAHLGKDSYSHIHYDSQQARTISVREAARLQSFPDGFTFTGPMNPAFRQIGNAVPPLMAKALAETIRQQLTGNAVHVAQNRIEEVDVI